MVQNTKLTKMIFWAMMVAVGVVISPLLRIEGMCPMAHFINVTCAVLLGRGMRFYAHWQLDLSAWHLWAFRRLH